MLNSWSRTSRSRWRPWPGALGWAPTSWIGMGWGWGNELLFFAFSCGFLFFVFLFFGRNFISVLAFILFRIFFNLVFEKVVVVP